MTFSPSNVARRARATCVWRQRRGLSTVRKSVSQNHRRVASVARVRTLNPLVARLLRRRLSARARAALSPVIARSEARGRRAIAHSVSNDAFRARSLRRHRATLLQRWFRPRPQNFDLVSAEISLAPRRPIARVAPRRIEKPRTARVFTAPLALDRRRAPNRAAARGRARESTERGGVFRGSRLMRWIPGFQAGRENTRECLKMSRRAVDRAEPDGSRPERVRAPRLEGIDRSAVHGVVDAR